VSKRFIRLPEVMTQTGMTRSSIYAEMGLGQFPKSFQIGSRAVAWDQEEIEAWKLMKLRAAGREVA
jgi:prophage regulatory protein